MKHNIRPRHQHYRHPRQRKGIAVARALPVTRQHMFMDAAQTVFARYSSYTSVVLYLAISATIVVLAENMYGLGYEVALVLAMAALVIFKSSFGHKRQRKNSAKE